MTMPEEPLMDEPLVRYLLDDLPPDDRAAVDARLADPAAAARLAKLRRVVSALSADHPAPVPPRGLATEAVSRTARAWIADGLFRPAGPPAPDPKPVAGRAARAWRSAGGEAVFAAGRRADVVVAAAVAVLAVGIGLSAVGKVRHESRVRACQENLHEFHTALAGYADARNGYYPQVGSPFAPTAGAVPAELARSGHLRAVSLAACPAGDPADAFAYTLGYVGPGGQLVGPRRAGGADGVADWFPVAADPAWAPHGAGPNVLFAAGNVRHAPTPAAGPDGDDIYHNAAGLVRAGLHLRDASLGTADDIP
jgi:hypothetical protein